MKITESFLIDQKSQTKSTGTGGNISNQPEIQPTKEPSIMTNYSKQILWWYFLRTFLPSAM